MIKMKVLEAENWAAQFEKIKARTSTGYEKDK